MNKLFISLIALVVALMASTASAQSAINATTLNGAVTSTQQYVVLTSATGVTANGVLYVDGEFMTVASNYSSGTTVNVIRDGNPSAHLTSAQVYIVPVSQRVGRKLVGSCVRGGTAQGEAYTLVFNMSNGDIGRCAGASGSRTWRWTNAYDTGTPSAAPPVTP